MCFVWIHFQCELLWIDFYYTLLYWFYNTTWEPRNYVYILCCMGTCLIVALRFPPRITVKSERSHSPVLSYTVQHYTRNSWGRRASHLLFRGLVVWSLVVPVCVPNILGKELSLFTFSVWGMQGSCDQSILVLGHLQPMSSFLQCHPDSQYFPVTNVIVAFHWREMAREKDTRLHFTFLGLWENGFDPRIWSIYFLNVLIQAVLGVRGSIVTHTLTNAGLKITQFVIQCWVKFGPS